MPTRLTAPPPLGDIVEVPVPAAMVGAHGRSGPGRAGRVRVHVREDGPADGPPLVLLHGFGGSMFWVGPVVPLLADEFRVVRVDLLGHGRTGGPAADAQVQAGMVESVLAHLDVERAVAVGHSFGADVAVELAEHSGRIDRLVIVTQAPDYSDATMPRAAAMADVRALRVSVPRLAQGLARVLGPALIARRVPVAEQPMAAQALFDFRALDARMVGVVLVDRRERMARRPLDAQVRAAGKPTLVVLGEKDHFYGARSAQRYRDAGAEVHVLPDADHSPLLEQPADVAALIKAFCG